MKEDEVAVTARNKHLQYDGRRGAVEQDGLSGVARLAVESLVAEDI